MVRELTCTPSPQRIVLSPDGRRFATYRNVEFRWHVYDSATAAEITRLEDDDMVRLRCSAFSPDGRLFASLGIDQLTVWDADTGERLYSLSREEGGFSPFLCFTPDSSRLLTSGPSSGEVVPQLPPDNTSTDVRGKRPPDEVSKTELLEVRVARTGQELVRLSFTTKGVQGVGEISQDGSRLMVPSAVGGDSGSEFVFKEPTSPTSLIVLLAAGAVWVVAAAPALSWLVRRLLARRRSALRPAPPPATVTLGGG
jgi:WD40 repeat protein